MERLVTKSLLIALDADGVLLDYNRGYGGVWEKHFGVAPELCEPRAYHATTYWGVENPPKDHAFWEQFDREGWANMPAMPGALEACLRLSQAGHTLVCVTSMPEHRAEMRLANLKELGFPIERVIATGTPEDKTINPKKQAIEALQPDWFVDDELRKLKDLPGVRTVLIDPEHPDTPNLNQEDSYLSLRVADLAAFAEAVLGPSRKPGMRA